MPWGGNLYRTTLWQALLAPSLAGGDTYGSWTWGADYALFPSPSPWSATADLPDRTVGTLQCATSQGRKHWDCGSGGSWRAYHNGGYVINDLLANPRLSSTCPVAPLANASWPDRTLTVTEGNYYSNSYIGQTQVYQGLEGGGLLSSYLLQGWGHLRGLNFLFLDGHSIWLRAGMMEDMVVNIRKSDAVDWQTSSDRWAWKMSAEAAATGYWWNP